jgi:purine nucleosidase
MERRASPPVHAGPAGKIEIQRGPKRGDSFVKLRALHGLNNFKRSPIFSLSVLLLATCLASAQPRRKVIINEDCSGPGGSNLQTLLVMIQSPQVEVLGITVVSGDQWRDEEVAHTLRLLEIIGRTDIPVVPGAAFPLVRTHEEAQQWQERYGKVAYSGAWDDRWWHEPFVVPTLPEGQPTTKPSDEDAAHFLIRMVRKYPHEVTIYEGGPMTNLALAISLDPQFSELADELIFMGGSIGPQTDNAEFINNPRHEFNFWFDPEAAHVLIDDDFDFFCQHVIGECEQQKSNPEQNDGSSLHGLDSLNN